MGLGWGDLEFGGFTERAAVSSKVSAVFARPTNSATARLVALRRSAETRHLMIRQNLGNMESGGQRRTPPPFQRPDGKAMRTAGCSRDTTSAYSSAI